jgi:hypothetical protein
MKKELVFNFDPVILDKASQHPDWLVRLVEEHNSVGEKADRLFDYLNSGSVPDGGAAELQLLRSQFLAMLSYCSILVNRIALHVDNNENK